MRRRLIDLTDEELFLLKAKMETWGFNFQDNEVTVANYHEILGEMKRRGLFNDKSNSFFSGGWSCLRSGDLTGAADFFRRAIEESPRFLDAYTNLGGCLSELGRPREALEVLHKGLEIGVTLDLGNNIDRAKALLRRAYHSDPDAMTKTRFAPQYSSEDDDLSAFQWNERGVAWLNSGDQEKAIECFDRALRLDSLFREAWNNKATSLRQMDQLDEAIRCLDRAIAISPDYAHAWYNKGTYLGLMGRFNESIDCFKKVLEIDPNDEDARRTLHRIGVDVEGGRHMSPFSDLFRKKEKKADTSTTPKTPNKFAGAMDFKPTLVRGGEQQRIWVGAPIVDAACPQCGQAVNARNNPFVLNGEPDYKAGTLPGALRCGRCSTVFNLSTYYFHDNFQLAPATFLALCILTDEHPQQVLSRGFLPGRIPQEGVLIGEGAQIGRNVRFIPPVLINKGSIVADGCEIGPFVYLEDAKIEEKGTALEYCDVRRSVLRRDAAHVVAHDSYIG